MYVWSYVTYVSDSCHVSVEGFPGEPKDADVEDEVHQVAAWGGVCVRARQDDVT